MTLTLKLFPTIVQVIELEHLVEPILAVVDGITAGQHALIGGASSWGNQQNLLDHPALVTVRAELAQWTSSFASNYLGLQPVTITNSWFNVQGVGDQVLEHRHAMSVVSAAFYLDCAEGSSTLDFHDPVESQRQFEYNHISRLRHSLEACRGNLVLFPSWLAHSTRANTSSRRVVASWNSSYY